MNRNIAMIAFDFRCLFQIIEFLRGFAEKKKFYFIKKALFVLVAIFKFL